MEKFIYQAILTPDEEGYSVEVPDLPGCFTYGDTYEDAVYMAADAMKTYMASLLTDGEQPPRYTRHDCPDGSESVNVFFETDQDYVIDGETVSAAQAARDLGVSKGRITQMLNAGLLEGYREGRRTYISVNSVAERKKAMPRAGRPRKTLEA